MDTALLDVTEKLHRAGTASLSSVVSVQDFSAAFDRVVITGSLRVLSSSHQIILFTLQELEVSGTPLYLFTSYLKDHTFRGT